MRAASAAAAASAASTSGLFFLGASLLWKQEGDQKPIRQGQNHTTGSLFPECLRGKFGVTAHEGDS